MTGGETGGETGGDWIAANDVPFEDAIAWFRERVPMTPDEWEALTLVARQKAFKVAGVTEMRVVEGTWKALDDALAKGTTLRQFKTDAAAALLKAWAGSVEAPAWRLETIFRTNVQSAFSAGRYAMATDPEVLADRPYWLFNAIMDSRISKACKACDGVILPASDPFWATHNPPLHFNCRSDITPLSEDEAKSMGGVKRPKNVPAVDKGFGLAPVGDTYEPDFTGTPEPLFAEFMAKQAAGG